MSRSALVCQDIAEGGAVPTLGSADNTNGNQYPNSEREWVIVKNASGSSRTVTAKTQKATTQVPGMGVLTRADFVLTLADGDIGLIPPFPAAIFNTTAGVVNLDISGTGVTIAVFKRA